MLTTCSRFLSFSNFLWARQYHHQDEALWPTRLRKGKLDRVNLLIIDGKLAWAWSPLCHRSRVPLRGQGSRLVRSERHRGPQLRDDRIVLQERAWWPCDRLLGPHWWPFRPAGMVGPKRKNEKGSDRSLRRSFDRFLLFHFLSLSKGPPYYF